MNERGLIIGLSTTLAASVLALSVLAYVRLSPSKPAPKPADSRSITEMQIETWRAHEAAEKAAKDARIAQYKSKSEDERLWLARQIGVNTKVEDGPALAKAQEIADSFDDPIHQVDVVNNFYVWRAATKAKRASDGPAHPIILDIARLLRPVGTLYIEQLPPANLLLVRKDPGSYRGLMIRVKGTIIQIRKSETLFEGSMSVGGNRFVWFVTPGRTEGLVEGSDAEFVGIFVQQLEATNMLGGTTDFSLAVGRFIGQF